MINHVITPNIPCGCTNRNNKEEYLKIENYFSEFNTEVAKAQARYNLGISDKWNLKWGNIRGFIEEQQDLLEFLNKFLEDDKQTIQDQFEQMKIELTQSINQQLDKVEENKEEVEQLISNFEIFKNEFTSYVTDEISSKLDRSEFQTFVNTSQEQLSQALNLKVDKIQIPDIENPQNHYYTTRENENIHNVKEALDILLYKDLQISQFTVTPNEAEIGEVINELVYNWSYNKFINSQQFDGSTVDLSIRSKTLTNNINTTTSKTLTATDGTKSVSKTATITFKYGKYYGVSTTNPTSKFIISNFTRNLNLSKGSTFTVNATDGQYIYLLVPESMSDIKFVVNGFEGGFQIVNNNFQFTNNGITTKCILFRSDNYNLGNTTITIK